MATSFTTSPIDLTTDTALNAILEPFGFTAPQLCPLLSKTGASLAGGAVTHYLATRDPALGFRDLVLPQSADLDFWVCNPIPNSDEMFYARRAYTNLVIAEFMRLLEPLGFENDRLPPVGQHFQGFSKAKQEYIDWQKEFKTQEGITINVHWIYNRITRRIINLIFTDKSIKETVSKFDFPITFAYIFCAGSEFIEMQKMNIAFDSRVLEDLKDRLLTAPDSTLTSLKSEVADKRRGDRARKYMERYGLAPRSNEPEPPASVPEPPVSVADPPASVAAVPEPPLPALEIPSAPVLDSDEPGSPRKRRSGQVEPRLRELVMGLRELVTKFEEFTPECVDDVTIKRLQSRFQEAVSEGNLSVVNRMLQDPVIDPSANSNEAILIASQDGHVAVVDRLLKDPRVDPSANDNIAIRTASARGHVAVVERLLKDPRVTKDASAGPGNVVHALNSGFIQAIERGDVDVVNRLLADPHVDPSMNRNWPIRMASANGYVAVVNRLLQDPRVDPSANNNQTIQWASANGHVAVVELLLKDPRVDPSACDNEAIQNASRFGHVAVVDRLLADPRVDPSAYDNNAIKLASANGHVAVVDRLLQDPRVDPSANNNQAIRMASDRGLLAVVERLLADPRVDPSANDNQAVQWASDRGHKPVVELLRKDPRVAPQ